MRLAVQIWLGRGDQSLVIQKLIPKTRVEQMQSSVFHTTEVNIHRLPMRQLLLASKLFFILRVTIAQPIPRTARPLRHGIGLPLACPTALGTLGIYPLFDYH